MANHLIVETDYHDNNFDHDPTWEEILNSDGDIDFIFDENQMKYFLEKIGRPTDTEGFIINEKTGKRIVSNSLREIKFNDVGAVLPCCMEVIDKKIFSYSRYHTKSK